MEIPNSVYENTPVNSFPSRPVGGTDGLRRELAAQGKRNLFFLAHTILGYTKLRAEPHGSLCRFMEQVKVNRREVLMPRTHYKTTICTIADTIRHVINDPEIRILMVADTDKNAQRFMLEVGNHFKHNDFFRWLYPELIPDNFNTTKWNSQEILVPRESNWREPTVDARGAMSSIESSHYDGIKADDLVTEKHIHSDVELEKLQYWASGLEPLLVNDVEGWMDFVGSRKVKGDLYEWFERYYGSPSEPPREIGPHAYMSGALAIYSRGIYEGDKLIFPYIKEKKSGVSVAYVERMRVHDPARYHAQLANSPKGTGLNTFQVEDLRRYRWKENFEIEAWHNQELVEAVSAFSLSRVCFYDPSVAERKTSSKQAILVVGKGSGENRYLLHAKIGHFHPDEAVEELFRIQAEWRPEFFSIERRGFQGSIKYWLMEKARREGIADLPVIEYPPEGSVRAQWAKTEHIRGLQPLTRANLIWFPESMDDSFRELWEEFEFYPHIKWDDGLDALAQGLEWWPYSADPVFRAKSRMAEEEWLETVGLGLLGSPEGYVAGERWDEEAFLASLGPSGYGVMH